MSDVSPIASSPTQVGIHPSSSMPNNGDEDEASTVNDNAPDTWMMCHTTLMMALKWSFVRVTESVIELAPVAPYFQTLEDCAIEVGNMSVSIRVGNMRYHISVGSDYIDYAIVRKLAPTYCNAESGEAGKIALSFCSKLEVYLSNVIQQDDLNCIMWYVGRAMVDPCTRSALVFFVGTGGNGKSTTIKNLCINLQGTVFMLPRNMIGRTKATLTADDVLEIVTNRFIAYGDCNIRDSEINEEFIKQMGGSDLVQTEYGLMKVLTTGWFGVNKLWTFKSAYNSPWMVRCNRVIELNAKALALPAEFNSPPVSAKSVLLSIFGGTAHIATHGIMFNDQASFFQCLAGTWAIATAVSMPMKRLIELVRFNCDDILIYKTNHSDDASLVAILGIQSIQVVISDTDSYYPINDNA
ncbi:hypothetical protein BC830DRAFT_1078033 [Chytriomyces sp. MP71]|nr:hypothetical protein BC830DRAFT_1078033 [Chytriomyces sp. MP71]